MSKYFTPFNFDDVEAEILEELSDSTLVLEEEGPIFDEEALRKVLDKIMNEIDLIKLGHSKLLPGRAIVDKTIPTLNYITIIRQNPTQEALEVFLKLAAQDFTTKVSHAWARWLEEAKNE